jgi:hypothetical protein
VCLDLDLGRGNTYTVLIVSPPRCATPLTTSGDSGDGATGVPRVPGTWEEDLFHLSVEIERACADH